VIAAKPPGLDALTRVTIDGGALGPAIAFTVVIGIIFGLLASRQPQEVALHTIELFGHEVIPRFDRDPLHSTTRMRAAARA